MFSFSGNPEVMPSDEEQYYSDDENLANSAPPVHENIDDTHVIHKSEENEEDTPANEKTGNYYKDIKQCKCFKLIAYV